MSRNFARLLPLPLVLAALVLLGAGCTASPARVEGQPEAVAPTGTVPDGQPEAVAPTITPNTNPVTTPKTWTFPGALPKDQITNKQIRITTAKGDIVIVLYPDTAPLTVSNFVYLASNGYYNNLTFHRREEGFVIQGGDPKGNGTGGPGYRFQDELKDAYQYNRGTVAMANAGPNTNGSQFFVMLADVPLPKAYSIFGKVVSGMDVVDKIKVGDVMTKVVVENVR